MANNAAFVAWSRLSRRTRDLARILGADLIFLPYGPPYLRAWRETARLLGSKAYDVVFAQLPQGPLLLRLATLSGRLGFKLVADVHTGFVVYDGLRGWILNRPFLSLLRAASAVLAHNRCVAGILQSRLGIGRVYIAYDPLPVLPEPEEPPFHGELESEPFIVVPASWAGDEPLEYIARSIAQLEGKLRLVVTGDWARSPRRARRLKRILGGRLVLTGYLPEPQYSWVIRNSLAVVAATRRECTVLSALWEAVSAGKLAIVSSTSTLQELLGSDYPCLFNMSPALGPGLPDVIDRCLNLTVEERLRVIEAYERLRRLSQASIELVRSLVREASGQAEKGGGEGPL